MAEKQLSRTDDDIFEATLQVLQDQDIRITTQRRIIIKYMIESREHPTVEQIYSDLRQDEYGMSLATVYNNLNVLVDAGLVHEMKFKDVSSRYDFLGDQHHHIICTECGKVADFDYHDLVPIREAARDQTGYHVNSVKVELYGLCPDCQVE